MPRPSMGAPACGEGCGKIELQKEEVDGIDRGTEKNVPRSERRGNFELVWREVMKYVSFLKHCECVLKTEKCVFATMKLQPVSLQS